MPSQTVRPSLIYQRLKPRRSRVKTGCLPCRLRRKKCDETKPVCSGCKRNHLICSSDFRASDPGSRALHSTSDKKTQPNSGQSTSPKPQSSKNVATEAHHEDFSGNGQESFPKEVTMLLRQLSSPDMLGSTVSRHPTTQILFDFYMHETSQLLSIQRGPWNPFITCVIPLARSHSMIMDSVLALGGAHLCHTMDGADMKSASSTHYTLAVRQLKYELTRINQGIETDPTRLLLTIMLLSTAEVSPFSRTNFRRLPNEFAGDLGQLARSDISSSSCKQPLHTITSRPRSEPRRPRSPSIFA